MDPNAIYSAVYTPNLILQLGYHTVAEAMPVDSFIQHPLTAVARVVSETALRLFNLMMISFTVVTTLVVIVPQFIWINCDVIHGQGVFSLNLLKTNWLFCKLIVFGLAAEGFAMVSSSFAFDTLKLRDEIAKLIIQIQVQRLGDLSTFAAGQGIRFAALPDLGSAIQVRESSWRQDMEQEMIALMAQGFARANQTEFWDGNILHSSAFRRILQRFYSEAEISAAINGNWLEMQQRLEPAVAQERTNVIKPSQLDFHLLYYDAICEAVLELQEKDYEKEDLEAMFGDAYYSAMRVAYLKLLQRAKIIKGTIYLQDERGRKYAMEPFSSQGELNFQSMAEYIFSIQRGVAVGAFDIAKELKPEEIKQLRQAVRSSCAKSALDKLTNPRVRSFAEALSKSSRDLHAFHLWDIYEQKEVKDFVGLEKFSLAEIEQLRQALASNSGEKIDSTSEQVRYAFRLIGHVVESIILRRVLNTNRYSQEQERNLPLFANAFAGKKRTPL